MGKTATNISMILGVVTIAFAGYYVYTQQSTATLGAGANEQNLQNMLNNTKVFIARGKTLDTIKLETEFFEDERFMSLRTFSTPIQSRSIGRRNPFDEADPAPVTDSF